MREEEAKTLARKTAAQRFRQLFRSWTGLTVTLTVILIGATAGFLSGYLSGYNEHPRVVFYQEEAEELQKSLTEARQLIQEAVRGVGISNIPRESQEKIAMALGRIELVDKALVPNDDQPAIFLPKWSWLASPAYAAETDAERVVAKEDFRQNLAMGILIAISVFWVVCLFVYFFSKDDKKIAFAATMIQTVLGFYIGVFTGLLGLSPPT